jgi:ectoine hydroxylase-related dioxygenase (phytanoyl-CoA dioxygenase family)
VLDGISVRYDRSHMMVSDAGVRFFHRHGWLIVRRAIGPRRLAELTRAFDRVMPAEQSDAPGATSDAAKGRQIIYVRGRDSALHAWALDRALGRLVANLLGWRAVRLLQDVLLLKPPRTGQRIKWHQDYGYIASPLEAPSAVSIRLALTAENVTTGCLQVLDRSHARGLVDETSRVLGPVRPLALRPGDLSIHHCLTLHWSGRNRSPHPRKTIILFAFDGDCRLDPHRGPVAGYPTEPGKRLLTRSFPVMFARKRRAPAAPRRARGRR